MAKTVLPSKIQEWTGLDLIQQVTHSMNCVYREQQKDDYGVDGEIEVVVPKTSGEGLEATGGIIKFQSKSGKSYVKEDSDDSFAVYIDKSDIEYWHQSNVPILFIVYHPNDDKLYFREAKEYIRSTPDAFKSPYKMTFQKSRDEFNKNSFETLREIAGNSPARVFRGAKERLYSNLLTVKKLPDLITFAPTDYISREEVFAEAKRVSSKSKLFIAPFFIKENKLYTIDDLRNPQCSLRRFCDATGINDASAEAWAKDPVKRGDLIYLLNQLFGLHSRECGLAYNSKYKKTYFPRKNKKDKVFHRKWHNVRTGRNVTPRIVVKHYQYGKARFWRHTAVNVSFRLIGESWYLQIIPQYFFTSDGEDPSPGELVGPFTTGIKSQERNLKVLNDVLFWSDVLSKGKHEIEMKLHKYNLVILEKTPASQIADFAIPNDSALYEEEEESPDFFKIWNESESSARTPDGLYSNDRIIYGAEETEDEY